MRSIGHSGASQVQSLLVSAFFAASGIAMLSGGNGAGSGSNEPVMVGALLILIAAAAGAMPIMNLLSGRPALYFDGNMVQINGPWRRYSTPWSDVRDVTTTRRTLYVYGIIPIRSDTILQIKVAGGLLGTKTLGIDMKKLDLDKEQWPELITQMAMARTQGNSLDALTASDNRVDADAVIARYLSSKEQAPQPRQAPKSVRAPAASATAGRPQFGRRAG